jgi:hypothetical protein
VSGSSALQRSLSISAFSFLPPRIWAAQWSSHLPPGNPKFTMEYLTNEVLVEATKGQTARRFVLRGPDVPALAISLKKKLAAAAGDFTNILSTERDFLM